MKKLGEILMGLGYLKPEELERAIEMQKSGGGKKKLGEILTDILIKDEQLLEALSIQYELPICPEMEFPESLPIEDVSFPFLKENSIIPLSITGNVMNLVVADLTKTDAFDTIRATYGYDIKLFIGRSSAIASHLEALHISRDAQMQRALAGVAEESLAGEDEGETMHLKDLAQEKGIIQLANLIIDNAVKDKASDIHIEPEETSVRVRYRIDGILYDKELLPVKTQAALSSRIKLLSQMNIAERRLPQDGRIKGNFGGREIDIRVSTIPTIFGESIVMRLLTRETEFISLMELGFDELLFEKYDMLIRRPFGMVLVTGPTGSGKTTTLYASLDRINTPDKKIITAEEPVEYIMRGINQIHVRPKIGLTFSSGLRHIVRQDPDIIMVGEIRDLETASISIHAALTGHLLFSTLHTNDAPSAITRLIDMGVENYLVSSTLVGVMAQRLVRKLCPDCKQAYKAEGDVRLERDNIKEAWKAVGCDQCLGTGYRGRIGIFEVLVVTDDIRDMVMRKATAREIREESIKDGMRTLRQDGIEKVKRGITTIEEVFRVTQVEL